MPVHWHAHGPRAWDVIATDGAMNQVVDRNGCGVNRQGALDPEAVAHRGTRWRADGRQLSVGRMIVGRRFADATVLCVAHAYEQAGRRVPGAAARSERGVEVG